MGEQPDRSTILTHWQASAMPASGAWGEKRRLARAMRLVIERLVTSDAPERELGIAADRLEDYAEHLKAATVSKLLAPVAVVDFFCIGLNYAFHAEEGGHAKPEFPVLFMKNVGAVQNPGDPIIIPKALKCETVDFECEASDAYRSVASCVLSPSSATKMVENTVAKSLRSMSLLPR